MPTKYVKLDDDRAIHVVHAGPTTVPGLPPPMGRGAVLVLLHGEGGSAQLWARQIGPLGVEHSPIAIDLPGHGRSTGLDGPATLAEAAAVVTAVLTAIGAPPAVLIGHGMGGQIALVAALERPDLVRAVVTIGAAARPDVADRLVEQLEQVVQGRLGQQFDTPFFGEQADVAVMRELWGEIVKTDPRVRLADLLAYRASDLRDALPRVAVPVLVLQGGADRLCARERADELAAAIPGARCAVVEGAGHVAHLERPEAVSQAITDFVAGL
jgi:3-oxoadipate enol-lactonase